MFKMLELASLYITSVFLIGALTLLGRRNQHAGWRRTRARLAEEIQDTMNQLRIPQSAAAAVGLLPGTLTPEANVTFSMQLAKLQSRLARHGSASPAGHPAAATVEKEGLAVRLRDSNGSAGQ